MDSRPLLVEIGRRLNDLNLEAVLIGNAAAALQGAPVTTVDFDFLFRKTPRNIAKLKALAKALGATVMRPFYPASDMYRVVRDHDGLQLDFMATIHGVRSFEGVRDRAAAIDIDNARLMVASLDDIIRSNVRRAGRATWRFSRSWRRPVTHAKSARRRRRRLDAVALENERAVCDMIRRWQRLPPDRRTNFLRKRVPFRGSAA